MVTFLSGGTGTPKLLDGAGAAFSPEETTVIANTGDDVEIGGLFVCPDVDTLLYQRGGILDRETFWGISDDTDRTHAALHDIADAADLSTAPQYLDDERQTAGRDIADWRRFSGAGEFMRIGDRDRAFHITRTSLLDRGATLSEATATLAAGLDVTLDVQPMSDDPVTTLVHTPEGPIHFQEFWVHHGGEPAVEDVEFRGAARAEPAPGVLAALEDAVVVGPSNPVTGIGPMLALPGVIEALRETTVVVVSPFVGDEAFSGPAVKLMDAVEADAGTSGLSRVYPFADAFVIDETDNTTFEAPVARTDISIDGREDAARVVETVAGFLGESR
jgi:LPPG:FO 2-phospho-L-lactate transferase